MSETSDRPQREMTAMESWLVDWLARTNPEMAPLPRFQARERILDNWDKALRAWSHRVYVLIRGVDTPRIEAENVYGLDAAEMLLRGKAQRDQILDLDVGRVLSMTDGFLLVRLEDQPTRAAGE